MIYHSDDGMPPYVSRLKVLILRIDQWEGIEDQYESYSVGDELLLDIKQCLESIVLMADDKSIDAS